MEKLCTEIRSNKTQNKKFTKNSQKKNKNRVEDWNLGLPFSCVLLSLPRTWLESPFVLAWPFYLGGFQNISRCFEHNYLFTPTYVEVSPTRCIPGIALCRFVERYGYKWTRSNASVELLSLNVINFGFAFIYFLKNKI